MGQDYFLYIHGVNTREAGTAKNYASRLIEKIQAQLSSSVHIPLYWGNLDEAPEDALVSALQKNPIWKKFWFRSLRENQIMRFVGDAALYISRAVGSKIVDALYEQALSGLKGFNSDEDRLHLVTHSWGTIILFDVLFAARWLNTNLPASQRVREIRDALFGLGAHPDNGAPVASLHTMGSPITLFSLFDAGRGEDPNFSHDITPSLQKMLERLAERHHRPTPWRNFAHPGDPIAYPIETILPDLVDPDRKLLDLRDVITVPHDIADVLIGDVASQQTAAILHGGAAHGSYWESDEVARGIVQAGRPLTTLA